MKQITKLMFVAAAMAALVSCAKEKELEPTVQEGIKVTIVASKPDVTKTVISADGKSVDWKAGDAVGFFKAGASSQIKSDDNGAVLDAEGRAAFTATIPASEEGEYYVYYPYSDKYQGHGSGVSETKIAEEQRPTLNSFDPMADILVSEPFTISATGDYTTDPAQLRFRRLSAFLKIHFADLTTGSILSGQFTEAISILDETQGDDTKRFAGRIGLVGEYAYTSGTWTTTVKYDPDTFEIPTCNAYVAIRPNNYGGRTYLLTAETKGYTISKEFTLPADFTLAAGQMQSIKIKLTDDNVKAKPKELKRQWVWQFQSAGSSAWNTVFGGTAGSDRNIAMDDKYVYVAENTGTAKMWAISISDKNNVTPVTVTGVTGGTHSLACPRVIKNEVGDDILVASNLTRGGEEPKLYMWLNGINDAPKAITLVTSATGAWYGDVFTVYGTMQNGILLFDKIGGENVNGVVTFDLNGIPSASTEKLWLHKRIGFNVHLGACAYYPFPNDIHRGIYSPGRGCPEEGARGRSVVIDSSFDFLSDGNGATTPTLTELAYADGRNGFVLGYNFIEWQGKRYVIYGRQPNSTQGYVYVLEGSATDDWLDIANNASVKFRFDVNALAGCSLSSGNSGMDITARVIGDDLYIAVQKQNIACELYRLYYE